MTMSISSAPSATAPRTSASRVRKWVWPEGNAVATEATLTPVPPTWRLRVAHHRRVDADGRRPAGWTGSSCGRSALRQRDSIFPGVSLPSRVVRSVIETAILRPQTFADLLDAAGRELRDPLLDAHLVHGPDLVEEARAGRVGWRGSIRRTIAPRPPAKQLKNGRRGGHPTAVITRSESSCCGRCATRGTARSSACTPSRARRSSPSCSRPATRSRGSTRPARGTGGGPTRSRAGRDGAGEPLSRPPRPSSRSAESGSGALAPGELDRGLTLALDGVQDPGNVGTILRIADWFGIDRVVLSPGCADLHSQKVIQASMGSFARVRALVAARSGRPSPASARPSSAARSRAATSTPSPPSPTP